MNGALSQIPVCEIFAKASAGYCTGVLIMPGVVITARHVLESPDDIRSSENAGDILVRVGIESTGRAWEPARVLWESSEVDALLLAPTRAAAFRDADRFPLMRYSRMPSRPAACRIIGFPRAADRPDLRFNDVVDLGGELRPFSFARERKAAVEITGSSPNKRGDWSGLSGSGVFYGSTLVAIVLESTSEFESSLLKVRPVEHLLNDPACRAALQAGVLSARGNGNAISIDDLVECPVPDALPIDSALRVALDDQYEACLRQGVTVQTFHRLLIAIRLGEAYTTRCFEVVNKDLKEDTRQWLGRQCERQLSQPRRDTVMPANIDDDPVVKCARTIAIEEGSVRVDARHFFRALLEGSESNTIKSLRSGADALSPGGFDRIVNAAKVLRLETGPEPSDVSSFRNRPS